MNRTSRSVLSIAFLVVILALVAGSGRSAVDPLGPPIQGLAALESPATGVSDAPTLATGPGGTAWMTWFESKPEGGHRLLLSSLGAGRWSTPRLVAVGDSFYVNWAEVAGVLPLQGGRVVAQWPWKTSPQDIAYGVRMAVGGPSGKFGPTLRPHDDNSRTPHGFTSMIQEGDGVRVLWLDGRFSVPRPDSAGDTELRTVVMARDGRMVGEQVLDRRVCDCCRTALVAVPGGALAVYRDRTAAEVRDIMLVRLEDGKWGEPYPLHADQWAIRGCPVNGPAAAARENRVVVAWHTMARGRSTQVAFSEDGGRTFAAPIMVDSLTALGKPQVALLEDGSALVAWEARSRRSSQVRVARVFPDGRLSASAIIGGTGGNSSGYPQMAIAGERVIFAWTDVQTGKPRTLRLYQARLAAATR